MIKDGYRYVRTVIDIDLFFKHTGNMYLLVGQRAYKGKTDANGNVLIAPGVTVTLQIMDDKSEPMYDKNGVLKDDNRLETFDATIVGVPYPLDMKKGDYVALNQFMPDISFYANYTLIMRFGEIVKMG